MINTATQLSKNTIQHRNNQTCELQNASQLVPVAARCYGHFASLPNAKVLPKFGECHRLRVSVTVCVTIFFGKKKKKRETLPFSKKNLSQGVSGLLYTKMRVFKLESVKQTIQRQLPETGKNHCEDRDTLFWFKASSCHHQNTPQHSQLTQL